MKDVINETKNFSFESAETYTELNTLATDKNYTKH